MSSIAWVSAQWPYTGPRHGLDLDFQERRRQRERKRKDICWIGGGFENEGMREWKSRTPRAIWMSECDSRCRETYFQNIVVFQNLKGLVVLMWKGNKDFVFSSFHQWTKQLAKRSSFVPEQAGTRGFLTMLPEHARHPVIHQSHLHCPLMLSSPSLAAEVEDKIL